MTCVVAGSLSLSAGVGLTPAHGALEDHPDLHPAPGRTARGGACQGAAGRTCCPIAQMKPASSRAMAVTTTVGFFPDRVSFR